MQVQDRFSVLSKLCNYCRTGRRIEQKYDYYIPTADRFPSEIYSYLYPDTADQSKEDKSVQRSEPALREFVAEGTQPGDLSMGNLQLNEQSEFHEDSYGSDESEEESPHEPTDLGFQTNVPEPAEEHKSSRGDPEPASIEFEDSV